MTVISTVDSVVELLTRKADVAISPSVIGLSSPPVTVTVERGRLRLFAKATGQSHPLYLDPEAARAEGHPDVLVPPTFLFGIELEQPDPFAWFREIGVDLATVLHGEQAFGYDCLAYAGDTLVARSIITDVYSKKGGVLELIERVTRITRGSQPIATLNQTIIVRRAV